MYCIWFDVCATVLLLSSIKYWLSFWPLEQKKWGKLKIIALKKEALLLSCGKGREEEDRRSSWSRIESHLHETGHYSHLPG